MSDTEGEVPSWLYQAGSAIGHFVCIWEVYWVCVATRAAFLRWSVPDDTHRLVYECLRLCIMSWLYTLAYASVPPGRLRLARLASAGCLGAALNHFWRAANDYMWWYTGSPGLVPTYEMGTFAFYLINAFCSLYFFS